MKKIKSNQPAACPTCAAAETDEERDARIDRVLEFVENEASEDREEKRTPRKLRKFLIGLAAMALTAIAEAVFGLGLRGVLAGAESPAAPTTSQSVTSESPTPPISV